MMRPLATNYGGLRLRSRTEARWCVFMDLAGIRFNYELEGHRVGREAYLPDFMLPDLGAYLEVKGAEPTDQERERCRLLAQGAQAKVLLAVGPPEERFSLLVFDRDGERAGRYAIARDANPAWGFWLVGADDHLPLGPITDATADTRPGGPRFGPLVEAYDGAQGVSFEYGRGKERFKPVRP